MAAWSAGISADLLGGALLPAADNGASRPLGIADRRSPPSCRHSFCSSPLPNSALFSPGARDSPGVSCLVSVRAPLLRVRAISASAASSSDTDGPDLSPRPSLPDSTPRAVLDFPPAEGFGEELTKLLTMLPRKVGEFGADNRAGIDRTLHRISAIRNRAGRIIGLTCRVGRAISGSAEMVRDLVAGGESVLLMGAPGVGKTTAIREVARILADECARRVVVVDTSNEIAGDGDIAHAAIGSARRMQVPHVELQHQVMIEAVENHMPQVVIIDEIGSELEAAAAATIAQRGVQLIATAHGRSVENLVKNPHLHTLAGGVQTVTLGDEEARRRGVQKSVMERGGPPVFQAAVEMHSRGRWTVHRNLAATVDALLSGKAPQVEVREMGQHGEVWVDGDAATAVGSTGRGSRGSSNSGGGGIPGASSGSAGTGLPQVGSWNEQGWQRLGGEGAMGVMGVREWDAAQPRGGGGRQSERFNAVRPSHAPSPSAAGRTAASPLGFASGGGSSGESSGSDTDSEGSDVDVYGDGGGSDTDGGGEQWGRSAMWWGGMASRSTSTAAGTTSSSASIAASSSSAAAPSPSWSQGGSMPAALSAFAQATRSDNSTLLFLYQVSEEHVEQVVEVMGLAPLITLTTDIAAADAVLALRSKLKGNAWLRGVAKFRHLPIYAVKVGFSEG
ncbi:unnamed protein product [Closterium sp. Naga37s-1]|nr:unnamed protein product [Closterium sp. Naga37s-1]